MAQSFYNWRDLTGTSFAQMNRLLW